MVDFLIVGTARSGTTLVQRLACELPNVHMPPETRFFEAFVSRRWYRVRFPLGTEALRQEIVAYSRRSSSQGLNIDVEAVVKRLEGRCDSYPQLFDAIVATLAQADEGAIIGEKTPIHLQWWRPITRALPELRLVAVVRDPRSVAASYRQVWNGSHLSVAARWNSDQTTLAAAQQELGERLLLLKYEDVVADPGKTQESLGAFLGVSDRDRAYAPSVSPQKITVASEWWKSRVFEPVTQARVTAWQDTLTPKQADQVLAVCRPSAPLFGYPTPERKPARAFISLGPRDIPVLTLARIRHAGRRTWRAHARF